MTIETDLSRIASALEAIVSTMVGELSAHSRPPEPAPKPVGKVTPERTTASFPQPDPMTFPQPVPPAPSIVPFHDNAGLVQYCLGKYKDLGPVKGAMIQQILGELGHTNISGLRPDQYEAFYIKVESL